MYGYKRNYDTKQDKSDGIIDFSQGNLQQTNNYLDIAIQGKGFFKVKDNNGNIYYTRYGKLGYDNESCSLYILVKDSKYFFAYLMREIKNSHNLDNPEAIAFLYGQIDHFILDVIMHPLIYYMTDDLPKEHLIDPHGLVENLIDDYVMPD